MIIKRRKFLQGIGGLTILGTGQFAWCDQFQQFGQALAQKTGRKLALLIGINNYADQPLRGCLTDVQLMQELLIHRFGFATGNIISLTDQQATRENILNTWQSFLKSPIQPDDLILLHFSGYGQRLSLSLPNSNLPTNLHGLIPIDRLNNSLYTSVLPIFASDLYRELPASNIITVLDTSYDYPEKLSNWRSRSRPSIQTEIIDSTIANLYSQPESGEIKSKPGVLLSACQKHQIATELDYNGFSAGLFTYTFSQTLWESLPATKLIIDFNRISNRVIKLANPDQQPQLQINKPLVNLIPVTAPTPAVITAIEDNGKTARLWLGGILPENLEYISSDSIFIPNISNNLLNNLGNIEQTNIQLTIKNRQGLTAKAHINYLVNDQIIEPLQPGTILREIVRIIPKSIPLKIALDASLAKIEKVDATSNFSAIPQMTVVNTETTADFIFGRQPDGDINPVKDLTSPQLYQGEYALFSRHANLLNNTCVEGTETVKSAIQRLTPYLQNLLAIKTLRLTENKLSTNLPVRATLATIAPQAQVIMQEATQSVQPDQNYTPSFTVPLKTRIRTNLYNDSDRPLYYTLFLLDTAGRLLILSPMESSLSILQAGANTIIPPPNNGNDIDTENVGWKMSGPAGFSEIYLVLTEKPCENMITALTGNTKNVREYPGLQELTNPLKVIKALLTDLQNQSSQTAQKLSVSPDDLALNLQNWVTLNFSYQVL